MRGLVSGQENNPSPDLRRLEKTPSQATLSPRERAGLSHRLLSPSPPRSLGNRTNRDGTAPPVLSIHLWGKRMVPDNHFIRPEVAGPFATE